MLRAFLLSLSLAATGFFLACNEGSVDPVASTGEIAGAGKVDCPLTEEIADVFSDAGLKNAVTKQCQNIAGELDQGDTPGAVEKAFSLIDKILGHHADGETTGDDEAAATLLNALLELVGLEGIFPATVDENTGGGTCDSGGCTIVNQSGLAGISVPPQTSEGIGMCYITFNLLDFNPDLFAGFDNYPFQFDYEIVCADEATGGLELAQEEAIYDPPAIVGVCFADPPLGPTLEEVPNENRQLAHLPDGEEEPELLPVAEATFLSDEDCAEASDGGEASLPFRALAKLEPISEFFVSPLWANPGRLGGAIAAHSPIGPVDNRGVEEDGGIEGTVIGCFESVVAGAQVDLFTSGEELFGSTTSDASGFYSFTEVPPGDYFLTASSPGLTFSSEEATVVSGETTQVNIGPPTSGCIG
ncbi:MAG TPA: carboxypeptidase-like regulatory domain-containing protein [Gemmatimonadota bacterium]|nr:carboxypeptidase-like regulatory domain-containing protein [Gemmatimonadota bacterium]